MHPPSSSIIPASGKKLLLLLLHFFLWQLAGQTKMLPLFLFSLPSVPAISHSWSLTISESDHWRTFRAKSTENICIIYWKKFTVKQPMEKPQIKYAVTTLGIHNSYLFIHLIFKPSMSWAHTHALRIGQLIYTHSQKGVFCSYSLVKPIYLILLLSKAGDRRVGVITKTIPNHSRGVSNPWPEGHTQPRMATNAAQHKTRNLLKIFFLLISFC